MCCRDDQPGNTHLDAVRTAAVSFDQEFNGENEANSESFEWSITCRSFRSSDQSLLESFVEEYFLSEDNSFDEHDSYDDYSSMFIKLLLFLILQLALQTI